METDVLSRMASPDDAQRLLAAQELRESVDDNEGQLLVGDLSKLFALLKLRLSDTDEISAEVCRLLAAAAGGLGPSLQSCFDVVLPALVGAVGKPAARNDAVLALAAYAKHSSNASSALRALIMNGFEHSSPAVRAASVAATVDVLRAQPKDVDTQRLVDALARCLRDPGSAVQQAAEKALGFVRCSHANFVLVTQHLDYAQQLLLQKHGDAIKGYAFELAPEVGRLHADTAKQGAVPAGPSGESAPSDSDSGSEDESDSDGDGEGARAAAGSRADKEKLSTSQARVPSGPSTDDGDDSYSESYDDDDDDDDDDDEEEDEGENSSGKPSASSGSDAWERPGPGTAHATHAQTPAQDLVFGFASPEHLRALDSGNSWQGRGEAIDRLEADLRAVTDAAAVTPHASSLLSFLASLLRDPNFKIAITTLSLLALAARLLGRAARESMPKLVPGLLLKLGDGKIVVRNTAGEAFAALASAVGPELVVHTLLSRGGIDNRNWHVREGAVRVVTAALLRHRGAWQVDVRQMVKTLWPALMDPKAQVQHAASEAFAVLQSLSPRGEHVLSQIAEEGLSPASQPLLRLRARLQDPRLPIVTPTGLVEFPGGPSPTSDSDPHRPRTGTVDSTTSMDSLSLELASASRDGVTKSPIHRAQQQAALRSRPSHSASRTAEKVIPWDLQTDTAWHAPSRVGSGGQGARLPVLASMNGRGSPHTVAYGSPGGRASPQYARRVHIPHGAHLDFATYEQSLFEEAESIRGSELSPVSAGARGPADAFPFGAQVPMTPSRTGRRPSRAQAAGSSVLAGLQGDDAARFAAFGVTPGPPQRRMSQTPGPGGPAIHSGPDLRAPAHGRRAVSAAHASAGGAAAVSREVLAPSYGPRTGIREQRGSGPPAATKAANAPGARMPLLPEGGGREANASRRAFSASAAASQALDMPAAVPVAAGPTAAMPSGGDLQRAPPASDAPRRVRSHQEPSAEVPLSAGSRFLPGEAAPMAAPAPSTGARLSVDVPDAASSAAAPGGAGGAGDASTRTTPAGRRVGQRRGTRRSLVDQSGAGAGGPRGRGSRDGARGDGGGASSAQQQGRRAEGIMGVEGRAFSRGGSGGGGSEAVEAAGPPSYDDRPVGQGNGSAARSGAEYYARMADQAVLAGGGGGGGVLSQQGAQEGGAPPSAPRVSAATARRRRTLREQERGRGRAPGAGETGPGAPSGAPTAGRRVSVTHRRSGAAPPPSLAAGAEDGVVGMPVAATGPGAAGGGPSPLATVSEGVDSPGRAGGERVPPRSPLRRRGASGSARKGGVDAPAAAAADSGIPPRSALEPPRNPERRLASALGTLGSGDWEEQMDALNAIRAILVHHPDAVRPSLHDVSLAIVKHADNLRSTVSRCALVAAGDVFDCLGKAADVELDTLLPVLLRKSTDTSVFLSREAATALQAAARRTSPQRVILTTLASASHRSASVRARCAEVMASAAVQMGDALCDARELPRLVAACSRFIGEASAAARKAGRALAARMDEVGALQCPAGRLAMRELSDAERTALTSGARKGTSELRSLSVGGALASATPSPASAASPSPASGWGGASVGGESQGNRSVRNGPAVRRSGGRRRSTAQASTALPPALAGLPDALKQCESGAWGERLCGVEAVERLATSAVADLAASGRFLPVCERLGERVADANTKVAMRAAEAVESVARAAGAAVEPCLHVLVPALGSAVASTNRGVRAAATAAMDRVQGATSPAALCPHLVREGEHAVPKARVAALRRLAGTVGHACLTHRQVTLKAVLPALGRLVRETRPEIKSAALDVAHALADEVGPAALVEEAQGMHLPKSATDALWSATVR